MIYRIFHPTAVLSEIVEHYWYTKISLTESAIQLYATPLLQGLAFNFNQQTEEHAYNSKVRRLDKSAYIFGQSVCPRVITTNQNGVDILGVKFKPLGITKITGINMEYLADEIINVEDIWGNELELLCDEMQSAPLLEKAIGILEKFLIKKYLSTSLHYRIENAQHALTLINGSNGSIDIKTLQDQTNTSRKTLERAFMNYLGIHPKLYARIVRFNSVKDALEKNLLGQRKIHHNLTSLALEYGFYDTSHFISEFKVFAGSTPNDYIKSTSVNLILKDL